MRAGHFFEVPVVIRQGTFIAKGAKSVIWHQQHLTEKCNMVPVPSYIICSFALLVQSEFFYFQF